MEPLSLKTGCWVLVTILLIGMIGVDVYNTLTLQQVVNNSRYEWEQMGGVIDKEGTYFILELED